MSECDIPGCSGDDSLPFTCNECSGTFCSKHRLPEKHHCGQLRSSDEDSDRIFSTGLQGKDDKKRGLTKRVTSIARPSSSEINQQESEAADDSAKVEDNNTEQDGEHVETTEQLESNRGKFAAVVSGVISGANRLWGNVSGFTSAIWLSLRSRLRNLVRSLGIILVLIGGIRLFSGYPIEGQFIIEVLRQVNRLLHLFPEVGWITYILAGLVVFWLAGIRTSKRSSSISFKSVLITVFVCVLISVLVVGFTPITLPDGTPDAIREPIQDAADVSAGAVENLTDETTETQPQGGVITPAQEEQTPDQSSASTPSVTLDRGRIEQLIHDKINERRASRNLRQLDYDSQLQEIARYHSKDMAERDYFGHTAPDGETMSDRYDKFGYNCRVSVGSNRYATGAENVFRTKYSGLEYTNAEIAEETVSGWMNSPGHRENIIKDYWGNEGIGVYIEREDGSVQVFVTQNFC